MNLASFEINLPGDAAIDSFIGVGVTVTEANFHRVAGAVVVICTTAHLDHDFTPVARGRA